jgi:hypothetical protein
MPAQRPFWALLADTTWLERGAATCGRAGARVRIGTRGWWRALGAWAIAGRLALLLGCM